MCASETLQLNLTQPRGTCSAPQKCQLAAPHQELMDLGSLPGTWVSACFPWQGRVAPAWGGSAAKASRQKRAGTASGERGAFGDHPLSRVGSRAGDEPKGALLRGQMCYLGRGHLRSRNTGEKEEEEKEGEEADIPGESSSVWRGRTVQGCNMSQMRWEGLSRA